MLSVLTFVMSEWRNCAKRAGGQPSPKEVGDASEAVFIMVMTGDQLTGSCVVKMVFWNQ